MRIKKLSREIISKRIDSLIEEYDFESRKKSHSEECICYKQNKKCHNLEKLNCFFCFCPHYDIEKEKGGCKINSSKGKYIKQGDKEIFDCSNCDYPHKRNNVKEELIKRLYGKEYNNS